MPDNTENQESSAKPAKKNFEELVGNRRTALRAGAAALAGGIGYGATDAVIGYMQADAKKHKKKPMSDTDRGAYRVGVAVGAATLAYTLTEPDKGGRSK